MRERIYIPVYKVNLLTDGHSDPEISQEASDVPTVVSAAGARTRNCNGIPRLGSLGDLFVAAARRGSGRGYVSQLGQIVRERRRADGERVPFSRT